MGCVLTLRKKLDTDTGKQRVVCALPVSIEKTAATSARRACPDTLRSSPPSGQLQQHSSTYVHRNLIHTGLRGQRTGAVGVRCATCTTTCTRLAVHKNASGDGRRQQQLNSQQTAANSHTITADTTYTRGRRSAAVVTPTYQGTPTMHTPTQHADGKSNKTQPWKSSFDAALALKADSRQQRPVGIPPPKETADACSCAPQATRKRRDERRAYRDVATGDIDAWRAPAETSAARPASAGTNASVTLAAKAHAQTNTQQASFMVLMQRLCRGSERSVIGWDWDVEPGGEAHARRKVVGGKASGGMTRIITCCRRSRITLLVYLQ